MTDCRSSAERHGAGIPNGQRSPAVPRITPSETDRIIGARVREARRASGMSQPDLGEILNVSFEQISTYERGLNRVAAATLARIAKVTSKPITFFFEEVGEVA